MSEQGLIPKVDPDLMRTVARSVPRMDSTAPPDDLVDLVAALDALAREIIEHNRRVMSGEPVDWSRLADQLSMLTRPCRKQVVPVLHDIGDSGGR